MKKNTNDPRRTLLTDAHVERNKIMKKAGEKMAQLSKEQPRSAVEAHAQYDLIMSRSSRSNPPGQAHPLR
jgi:hypothetical protein